MPRGMPGSNATGKPLTRHMLAALRELDQPHPPHNFDERIQNALLRRKLIEWSHDDLAYCLTAAGRAAIADLDQIGQQIIPDAPTEPPAVTSAPLSVNGEGSGEGFHSAPVCPPDCPYRVAIDFLARSGMPEVRGLVADITNLQRKIKKDPHP